MNSKQLELQVKDLIKKEFERYFDIAGSNYAMEFYNIDRQKEIKEYIVNELSKENNVLEIKDLFDKNYIKILKHEEEKYKLNDEYKYNKLLEEYSENKENEDEKIEKDNKVFEIIKTILYVIAFTIFLPITFIIMVLISAVKQSK